MFKKILLVRIGNIGDVLFTTPVIRKLRSSFPTAIIDIVTSPQGQIAVQGSPYIDNIFIYQKFPKLQRWFKRKIFINQLLKKKYDLCIVLESNLEYTQFAYRACPRALRIGIDSQFAQKFLNKTIEFSRKKHALENYLCVLSELLGIKTDPEDYAMDFFFTPPDSLKKELYQYVKGGFFVIHPSCSQGLPYRGWQADKLITVIKYLTAQGLNIFITGTAEDKEPALLLKELSGESLVHSFIGRSFNELACLIKNAKGIFCFDTGILHLARALGTPLLALFGPSDPKHTGPIGIGIYKVIRKDFSCGPCQYFADYRLAKKANCLNGNVTACMKAIEAEEVILAIKDIVHG
jgi:ADP-heptose:LPS heptosyltransferase